MTVSYNDTVGMLGQDQQPNLVTIHAADWARKGSVVHKNPALVIPKILW